MMIAKTLQYACLAAAVLLGGEMTLRADGPASAILTPPAGPSPRINGPKIFGVRPTHPILFTIPTTGDRPITFSADNLPPGVTLDSVKGWLGGAVEKPGEYTITLHAKNAAGEASEDFKLVVGETIALTPPMGWNHYNAFGTHITQEIVSRQAEAMAKSGLVNHGWTYMNIDDGWQGARGGKDDGIQPDLKEFPDIAGLSKEIHGLGLKFGIYSTPWIESYGHRIGGSADNQQGTFERTTQNVKRNAKLKPYAIGQYTFYEQDAKQFADWGVDYLKYDWNPIEIPETKAEYEILRNSGRDIVFSLSNSAPFDKPAGGAKDWMKMSNAWRTGGDIRDTWDRGVASRIFSQDKWAPYAGPGHWNDPDMMVLGVVGWGENKLHPTNLTPDEQYTHMSAWCLLSVPLLLGCDLTKLDPFTLSLLTNDEVIAVNQDELGQQATVPPNEKEILAKKMADGSRAAGLFNTGDKEADVTIKWADIGLQGKCIVRDLWRQKDLGAFDGQFTTKVPSHGVIMIRIRPGQ